MLVPKRVVLRKSCLFFCVFFFVGDGMVKSLFSAFKSLLPMRFIQHFWPFCASFFANRHGERRDFS